jgi:hypothetical protein
MITAPAPPRRIRTRYQRMAAAVQIAQRLRDTARNEGVKDAALGIVILLSAPIELVRSLESRLAKLAGPEETTPPAGGAKGPRAGRKSVSKD